jgi:hypothetical protein
MTGRSVIRYLLGVLFVFVALNAFAGGFYGMSGAEGVPTEWLSGTPFHDYFIPSLILFVVVGGSSLIGAIAVFLGHRLAGPAAFGGAAILLVWLAVQLSIIGYVSWMQPTTATVGLLVLILARLLPKSAQASREEIR